MAGQPDEQKPRTTLQDLEAETRNEQELSRKDAGEVKGGMISTPGIIDGDPDDPRLP